MNICPHRLAKKWGKEMAKLTFLWYDNFGENQTPLQRNGMATISKRRFFYPTFFPSQATRCESFQINFNISSLLPYKAS